MNYRIGPGEAMRLGLGLVWAALVAAARRDSVTIDVGVD